LDHWRRVGCALARWCIYEHQAGRHDRTGHLALLDRFLEYLEDFMHQGPITGKQIRSMSLRRTVYKGLVLTRLALQLEHRVPWSTHSFPQRFRREITEVNSILELERQGLVMATEVRHGRLVDWPGVRARLAEHLANMVRRADPLAIAYDAIKMYYG